MSTIVKEETPTAVRRATPGVPRRRAPWAWLLAVVAALLIGLGPGIAGGQAAGASAAKSTGNAAAATKALALRYIAAGMWTPGQAAMFADNAECFFPPENALGYGHSITHVPKAILKNPLYKGTIDAGFAAHDHYNVRWTAKERLIFVNADTFVIESTTKGWSSFTGKNFTLPGVSVSKVKNGKIVFQTVYFDPVIVYGPSGPPM